MKNLTILLLLITTLTGVCIAQTPPIPMPPSTTTRYVLDKSSVVKDSTGKQYSYEEWNGMMRSRKYMVKLVNAKAANEAPEFIIVPADPNKMHFVDRRHQSTDPSQPNFVEPLKPAESTQFHAGDVFKPFNEKDITGERFDLKKMKDKVFVINFWFIGCPPCRAEIPDLNNIVEKYKNNPDVVFIALCLDEKYDIKEFIKTNPYNYHIIDDSRLVAEKYGVHLYPTNVVVNKEGKVVFSSVSNQNSNPYWITKTINEALQTPANNTNATP